MNSFELSTYQKNILDNVNNSNTNLLVNAKAGSGKTSTLILIANNLIKQNKKCLFLAFNKSIVDELSTKIINENCQIKTIHALGLSFLRSYLYRKHNTNYELNIDDGKVRDITKKYFMDILYNDFMKANKDIGLDEEMLKDLMNDVISELIKLSNFCRLYNINYHDELQVKFLMRQSCRELRNYDSYGLQRFPEVIETIIDKIKFDFEHPVINDDGKAYYNIDFLDMIYFPCYYNMFVPFSIKQYLDCIMVDECIPGNMFVTTNEGKKTIKSLYNKYQKNKLNNILVKTFNETTEKFEYKNIINIKQKNVRDIYEIETYGLNKVQATDNHPFLTQNGWKKVSDLIPGEDYIYLDNTINQKCKLIPNEDQLQVIYGTALGDGSLRKNNQYEYRLRITQSEKQYNYFKFKKDLLQCNSEIVTKGGYTNSKIYNTNTRQFLLPVKNKIDIINKLDLRGLAILYMDDGSCTRQNPYSTIRISCNDFNVEETQTLINKFLEFGITVINYPHYNKQGKKYNELKMNSENGHKFLKLIAPYMNKDCFYKNPEATGTYKWDDKFKEFGGNIVKSVIKIRKDVVYDMEVEDNHNFIISKCSTNKKGSGAIVHNCQDLSILQQNFLRLLQTNDNRFIFVGDEKQAIYGFAGADTKSIENLKQNFILKELPLNICYRCPENVIKLSKSIVPSIEWNPKREDKGVVEFVDDIFKVDLQPNDMIIGRRNRDLIEIYKKFVIDKKVSVKFKNLKLVDSLVKEISQCIKDYIKLYVKNLNVDIKVYEYQKLNHMPLLDKDLSDSDKRELSKVRKEYIKQKSKESKKIMKSNYTLDYLKECMEEFREEGLYSIDKEALLSQYFDIIDSFIVEFMKDHSSILVKDLLDYIKSFLKGNLYEEAPVISTIHMMKGGEADTVYIYDYPKFPYKFKEQSEDEIQQEKNLLYVAITRAKKNLYLCLLKEDDEQSIEANLKARVNVKNLLKK